MPRECYYCHGSGTKRDGYTPCPVCNGSGEDPNWREKPCEICGYPLEYRINWDHPPNVHKECRERERQMWREKPCAICGQPLRYRTDWEHPPNVHKECRERERRKWQEKPCAICGQPLRYRTDWEHPPNVHKECRERERRKWQEKPCAICGRPVRYHIDWDNPPDLCDNCKNRKAEIAVGFRNVGEEITFSADEPLPYIGSTPRECGYSIASAKFYTKKIGGVVTQTIHITMRLDDDELLNRGLEKSRLSYDLVPGTGELIESETHAVYQRNGEKDRGFIQVDLNQYRR